MICHIKSDLLHIIHKVPSQAKSSVYASVEKENRTEEAQKEAQEGFGEVVDNILDAVIDWTPLPEPIKKGVKSLKGLVVDGVKSLWNRFFG